MPAIQVYDRSCGYVVTPQGREAIENASRCACHQLLVTDGLYQCPQCRTVYSVVMALSFAPRKLRGPRRH
jgi:hypothetical protein